MKAICLSVVLLLSCLVPVIFSRAFDPNDPDDVKAAWGSYKHAYGKKYASTKEENLRRALWLDNVAKINQHNEEAAKGKHSFTLGINHLTDRTPEEYSKLLGSRKPSTPSRVKRSTEPDEPVYYSTVPVSELPVNVNLTTTGMVGPVQNQGECGSCWAYSACGAIEGQYFAATGNFILLSEQNLVDCSTSEGNFGCDGGFPTNAYWYVLENGGIDSASCYPYVEYDYYEYTDPQENSCVYNSSCDIAKLTGWETIQAGNETALQQAVALIGPISVCIDASPLTFQYYQDGVYSDMTCTAGIDDNNIDHCILAVGYGVTSDGQDYWLLQNSWGTDWGMNGYMMMARNDGNMCGIASLASFPTGVTAA